MQASTLALASLLSNSEISFITFSSPNSGHGPLHWESQVWRNNYQSRFEFMLGFFYEEHSQSYDI